MPIKNRLAEWLPEITAWRHDFHAHPELLYEVHRTAARVAELLRGFGCDEVVEGIGRTGVVGVIRGQGGGAGRVVGLRADMDALPIEEATNLPYRSTVTGMMHACGHDGHSSMLLAAARYLAETRAFDGTVVVIFQPAEEGGAGAREMLRDGLMERFGIDEVYALHNMPGIPVGQFAIRPGAIMAAADQFDIVIEGKGGHAAMPQLCVDPVVAASHVILALQSIASRVVDPLAQVVVSVCTVKTSSEAHNVIPARVSLRGTVRTMDTGVQDAIEARLVQIVETTALAHGCRAEVDYRRGYPVTMNDPVATEAAVAVAEAISGAPVPCDTAPLMGAEDFSFMLNERPGAYMFLGNGDTAALHHPAYVFDDQALPYGASWLIGMAEARLAR
ncbi:M20 aminoacylase family protein [Pseudothioclava arenosa]|uniref:Amidohydrolase n=1 Tax=Pseudothioclava arenosa TaxID=1795308 RepID=A0A2A4CMH3_9RHOB|nr:M20 aminoacylase family protein [Pseudothioclava arenosa]PCD77203.1 amidohydrolase [Pseudothioclava arenosa]